MNLPDTLFTASWLWSGGALFVIVMLAAVYSAPWQRLVDSEQLHVWLGSCVALMVMWSIKAGISPGLNFHYLGATLLTLLFGWQLALLGLGVVLVAATSYGIGGWQALGLNGVLMAVLPVLASHGIQRSVARALPRHFFVYVFVTAFFGAALVMGLTGLSTSATLWAAGAYSADHLAEHYLPYFLLMAFPEAMITGAVIALAVVYRPAWVGSFTDRDYLDK